MLKDLIKSYEYGLKQLYYFNTYDGAGEMKEDEHPYYTGTEGNIMTDDEDCEACVI